MVLIICKPSLKGTFFLIMITVLFCVFFLFGAVCLHVCRKRCRASLFLLMLCHETSHVLKLLFFILRGIKRGVVVAKTKSSPSKFTYKIWALFLQKKLWEEGSLMEPWINDNYIPAGFISVDGKYIRSENWPGKGRFWTYWCGIGRRRAR